MFSFSQLPRYTEEKIKVIAGGDKNFFNGSNGLSPSGIGIIPMVLVYQKIA